MAYATLTDYRTIYIGRTCSVDATLTKWLDRASDDLDTYVFNGITLADLSVDQAAALVKACCAQAENYLINGDGMDDFESFSIGSFSIKQGAQGQDRSGILCEAAQRHLFRAGLSFRGVFIAEHRHFGVHR
jgi:hypothetical protein